MAGEITDSTATSDSTAITDVTIIGAGVMGLFTAVYAARSGATVTLIDSSHIGNPATASFGLTRSVRNDYQDIGYARLAHESRRLWAQFEPEAGEPLIVYTGMLNVLKRSVTPEFESSWAYTTHEVLKRLRLGAQELSGAQLRQRFPQFDVDEARLDVDAGFAYVPAATAMLQRAVQHPNITLYENTAVETVTSNDDGTVDVRTAAGSLRSETLVITAGHGSNDVLSLLSDNPFRCPTSRDRPSENKYFVPPPEKAHLFTPDVFPVFAYLDIGIYGHPWYPGKTKGVKIGFYNPPDASRVTTEIDSVEKFVAHCVPELIDAQVHDVTGVDQCDYDLVSDDEFILGSVPGFDNVFIGTGWRGTGYKFGPWVGRVLSQLSVQGGTFYDITRFDPARFQPIQ